MVPRIRPERVDIGWRCVHCCEYLSVTFDFAFFFCRNSMVFPFVTSTDLRMDGNMRPTSLKKMASGKKPGWKIGRNGNLFSHTRNLMLRWVQGISFGNAMPRQKLPWVCVASAFGDVPLWLAWNNSAIEPNKILSHILTEGRSSGGEMEIYVASFPSHLQPPKWLPHVLWTQVRLPKLMKPRTIVVQVWELQRRWWVIGWDDEHSGPFGGQIHKICRDDLGSILNLLWVLLFCSGGLEAYGSIHLWTEVQTRECMVTCCLYENMLGPAFVQLFWCGLHRAQDLAHRICMWRHQYQSVLEIQRKEERIIHHPQQWWRPRLLVLHSDIFFYSCYYCGYYYYCTTTTTTTHSYSYSYSSYYYYFY